ncbi:MAG TPA: ice-binding family protein [Solirubrobacterales bacterium]
MSSQVYGSPPEHAHPSLAERRPFTAATAMTLKAVGLLITVLFALVFVSRAQAATAIGLGTADSFAVLAGAGVTNTGPTVVNGDLGTYPTAAVSGFGGAGNGTVNGSTHQADALAGQAQNDLTTAFNNAAGQTPFTTLAGGDNQLGTQTLTPAVYRFGGATTANLIGTLTLDGQGDANAVFIFQATSTLVTAGASQVVLINGARSCNVFWQVGDSATLGAASLFRGTTMADQSISLGNAVTVDGRLLARIASVTLINDTITRPQCATGGGGGSGGGSGGPGGPGGKPALQITGVPGAGPGVGGRCTDHGFRAKISIHAAWGHMRRVDVFVNGKRIKRSTRKQFSVWINVSGLRSGRNTIRVVAVDPDGRRDVASRSFRRCARAVASPAFTG